MRETDNYYFFWKHQFGQWTLRDMVDVDGIAYNCCEQFMMYKKAILFGDKAIAQQLLAEKDPSAQQKMGRLIRVCYKLVVYILVLRHLWRVPHSP